MVVVVSIAVWFRHGLRRALLVTAPLAGAYLLWFITIGHGAYSRFSSPSDLGRFVSLGLAFTFSSLGHSPVVGLALAALLVLGTFITVRSATLNELRDRYSAPGAMLVGAVLFLVLTGFGRANGSLPSVETYTASRYLYVVVALLIPALGVAATQLVTIWKPLWPVVVVVLVLGVPGNIAVMHRTNYLHTLDGYRQFFLSLPRLPIATHLPRSIHPDPDFDGWVTMGWLLDGVRHGLIPSPAPAASPEQQAYWTLRLAWHPATVPASASCNSVGLPAVVRVTENTRLTLDAPANVAYLYQYDRSSASIQLSGSPKEPSYASSWPMNVRVTPTEPGQSATVCAFDR